MSSLDYCVNSLLRCYFYSQQKITRDRLRNERDRIFGEQSIELVGIILEHDIQMHHQSPLVAHDATMTQFMR